MNLTTREKVLITILLAVLWVWLGGCRGYAAHDHASLVSQTYLDKTYDGFNEEYFQSRLSRATVDMGETNSQFLASTNCQPGGANCVIHFNSRHITSERIAALIMLHEQCHVKTWMADTDSLGIQIEHGKAWRGCMLALDASGAFRDILID